MLTSISDSLYTVTKVVTWDMVREATASDAVLQSLHKTLQDGFLPKCSKLEPQLRPYHRLASNLSSIDGVIISGSRIVMPRALRMDILHALHATHQGVSAMCARAANLDIKRIRDECSLCHRIAKSNPMQPPSTISHLEYPFQKICSDYFSHHNHEYVVVVDRYSNWLIVFRSEGGLMS